MKELTEDEIVALLVEHGVLLENDHFGLASGRHSPIFVAKTRAGQVVPLMDDMARQIAMRYYEEGIDTVLAPGTGAISLGHAVARHMGSMTGRPVYCAFAMRPTVPGSPLVLKRGFPNVVSGRHVLVARAIGGDELHEPLIALAHLHHAGMVSDAFDISAAALKVYGWDTRIVADPEETVAMLDGIEERFEHVVEVLLVEAGNDIAMGHALALKIGELQEDRTPELIYAERQYAGSFTLDDAVVRQYIRGRKLLVVEDIVTTGGSIAETIAFGEYCGGIVEHATALWNRGVFDDPRLTTLVNRKYPSYKPGPACPGCVEGVPINQQFGHGR